MFCKNSTLHSGSQEDLDHLRIKLEKEMKQHTEENVNNVIPYEMVKIDPEDDNNEAAFEIVKIEPEESNRESAFEIAKIEPEVNTGAIFEMAKPESEASDRERNGASFEIVKFEPVDGDYQIEEEEQFCPNIASVCNNKQNFSKASDELPQTSGYICKNETMLFSDLAIKEEITVSDYSFSSYMPSVSQSCKSVPKTYAQTYPIIFKYKKAFKKRGKSYLCKLCSKSKKFFNMPYLRQHINFHHFTLSFICTECPGKFISCSSLRRHYKSKHNVAGPARLKIILILNLAKKQKLTKQSQASRCKQSQRNLTKSINLKRSKDNYKNTFERVDNLFICKLCSPGDSQKYSYKTSVRQHIKLHHFGYRYACSECHMKYMGSRDLRRHYKNKHNIEKGPNELPLTKDENEFDPRPKLNFNQTIKKIDNYLICTMCPQSSKYSSDSSLKRHIKFTHYGYRFACTDCDKKYLNSKSLRKHYENKHSKASPAKFKIIKNAELKTNYDYKDSTKIDYSKAYTRMQDYYVCRICTESEKYARASSVRQHIKWCHYNFRYKCTECNKKYLNRPDLKKHYQNFHNIAAPINFQISKTNKPMMNCKYEKQKCCFKNTYVKLENSFICRLCTETESKFAYRSGVRQHIKLCHFGYRYVCSICNVKYSRSISLKNHYSEKHGMEDNGRIQFEKTENDKATLNENKEKIDYAAVIQKVGNCYICTICSNSRKYAYKSGIRRHIRLQHHNYRYECPECDIKYVNGTNLKSHYNKMHRPQGPCKFEMMKKISD